MPDIISLSFINNVTFLVSGKSMLENKKSLEKIGKITLDWKTRNVVTYNIRKTVSILFSKT